MRVRWNTYASPLGPLTLVEGDQGPLLVGYAAEGRGNWAERLRQGRPGIAIEVGPCQTMEHWLESYFSGRPRPFSWPGYLQEVLGLEAPTVRVLKHLCTIPFGETRSYEQVAQAAGLHPRPVGQIVGANPLPVLVPCHRVVGKQGDLVGYAGGLDRKRWLLDHELRTSGLVLR